MRKHWFSGWLGNPAADGRSTPAPPAAAPAAQAPASIADATDLDPVFFRWLTGAGARAATPGAERLVLDELGRLAASPGAGAALVPRVPAVVPQLLRSLRDDNTTSADLSRILAQDVTLVAEVIRSANSPYYSPRAPIQTIEGAIRLLGENGMRLLLARVAFRPVISAQAGQLARMAAPQVWRHAEKCAMAASVLAPRLRADPFDAYLAGLMHNVGLIVAFRLCDQLLPDAVLPQTPQFYAALAEHARVLSARIAGMWDFPPAVASAIASTGHPGASALARTLAQADRLAKLRLLADAGLLDLAEPAALAGLDDASQAILARLAREQDG